MVARAHTPIVLRSLRTDYLDVRAFRRLYELAREAGRRVTLEDFVRELQQLDRVALVRDSHSGQILGYCDRLDQVQGAGFVSRRAEKLFELTVVHRTAVHRGALKRACVQFAFIHCATEFFRHLVQRVSGREREALRAG